MRTPDPVYPDVLVLFLEDHGYTAVPIHNPFSFGTGEPVRPGGTRPDRALSLRVIGCAAGLGELGLSKLLLTREFGPRQRVFTVLTDAPLAEDPVVAPGTGCDSCGLCRTACPARAIPSDRDIKVRTADTVYSHGELNCAKCYHVHQGWDPRYSPFCGRTPPATIHRRTTSSFSTGSGTSPSAAAAGCVRACMDHLERTRPAAGGTQGPGEGSGNAAPS